MSVPDPERWLQIGTGRDGTFPLIVGDRWRRLQHRLLNMNPNGRAFCLRDLSARRDVDLHAMAWVEMQDADAILSSLLQGKPALVLDKPDPHQEKSLRLDTMLGNLYRELCGIREERGQYPLYIGYPFITGKFQDGTPFRGPLFLIPVQLLHRAGSHPRWELQPADAPNGYWNRIFLYALELHHGFLPDASLASEWPENIQSLSDLHLWMHEVIKAYRLPLFVQQSVFSSALHPFRPLIKATLESLPAGRLDIFREGTLSLFPVADTSLFDDYEHLIRSVGEHPDFLAASSEYPVAEIPERERFWISSVDEYQEEALLSVHSGNNVLLHGPPGTGKTQVIRNAIAQAIGHGKTVLVVSQKRAALDVVHERLLADGLGEYCGLLHDAGADRNRIYSGIRKQIEDLEYTRLHHDQGFLSRLEGTFREDGDRTDEQVAWFDRLAEALTQVHDHGFSMHELYLKRSDTIRLPDIHPDQWNKATLETFREILTLLWPLREIFRNYMDIQPLTDWKSLSVGAVRKWYNEVSSERNALNALISAIDEVSSLGTFSTDETQLNAGRLFSDLWVQASPIPSFHEVWSLPDPERELLVSRMDRLKKWIADEAEMPALVQHTVPFLRELCSDARSLGMLPWFRVERWRILRKIYRNWPNAKWLDRRDTWKARFRQLEYLLSEIDGILETMGIQTDEHRPGDILGATGRIMDLISRMKDAAVGSGIHFDSPDQLALRLEERERLLSQYSDCNTSITGLIRLSKSVTDLNHLRQVRDGILPFEADLNPDFEAIREAGCIWEQLPTAGQRLLRDGGAFLQAEKPGDLVHALEQTLTEAWINDGEMRHPELTTLGLPTVSLRREDFCNRLTRKRNAAALIVKHRLQGRVLENIRYNRQHNRVTFRELYHQVSKKRNIWPVRKLVATHWSDELNMLRPCWLMSPEAASAVFPMVRGLFDLVILDEASQCFAEAAIPILWRGKQFIVSGDEQQLRPSSLYRTRIDGTEAHETDEIQLAESAMDLVRPYTRSHYLRWHYRSKEESLISFSNAHFYDNRLLSFPLPEARRIRQPFIWHSVRGIWKENTNREEAAAICDRIVELYQQEGSPSVAVVTFNYHQQMLIQEMLAERVKTPPITTVLNHIQQDLEDPGTNGLIIKNIENIQGDERDIILYSVGYGPDPGGILYARFGSLSQPGGENRLNVAITRARVRQEVFCSFHPGELSTGPDTPVGAIRLKSWLQYVLDHSRGPEEQKNSLHSGSASPLAKRLQSSYPGLHAHGISGYGNSRMKIGIALPQQSIAIECEGPEYFDAPGSRAREVYRPSLLEALGWKTLRIWARRPHHPELEPFR